MTLSTIKELQDLLCQDWFLSREPDTDEDGIAGQDVFTGEIVSHTTGDHIAWCDTTYSGQAMAEMIVAARALYAQFRGVDNSDDYIVPGPEADAFLRAFEEFVNKSAGW